jgi:hypothetical protein
MQHLRRLRAREVVGERGLDLSAVAKRRLAFAAGLHRQQAWVWRGRSAVLERIGTQSEEYDVDVAVVVVEDVGRDGWRVALVLPRELLLCSGKGAKAVLRISLERFGGVMRMPVESDEAKVSVVWNCG